jgi:hypothetical protein
MTRTPSANDRAIKEKELKWFRACQSLCPLFPPGEPQQNPSHARKPDIVFHHIGLGIEITEYLPKDEGGSPLRRSEVLRDRILQEAKKTFERSSNEQVVVLVSWDPHQEFSSITKTDVAEQVARTIINMLANDVNLWLPDWTTPEGKFLGRHIGHIDVWPHCERSAWISAESGTGGGDVFRVQQVIRGKETLVSKYRETCDNVWLLIVAEGHLSTFFSPDEDFPSAVFDTSFDQVFVFDAFHHQVRQLATRATSGHRAARADRIKPESSENLGHLP